MKDDFITRTVGWWELRRKVGMDDGKVGMEDDDKSEQTVGNMWESVPMGGVRRSWSL